MKKILSMVVILSFMLPAIAITEYDAKLQKAELKHQQKMEKIRRKQEIKCIKNPEACVKTTPIQETNLTLGTAQKNIKIGTSQDEVAMALGSPNIVTVDSEGKDTWIYDKVASVTSYNNSGFNIGLGGLVGGMGNSVGGGGLVNAAYGKNGGNAQSNQKTLTIVIKFTNSKVSSFQYHMSSF